MAAIERVITHGTFELDGGSWEVDNNIWLVGDDSEVVVFDAAHHAAPIIDAVGGRKVVAVICTHGHNDHVTVAPELGTALDAPVLMHPGDAVLWRMTHPDKSFRAVSDGDAVRVGGTELRALHTPGHSPDRCAGMRQSWVPEQAPCSAETRCSLAGRVQPAARIPTSPRSCGRYPDGSAHYRATPSCTPATATAPPSATRSSTTRNGWPVGIDPAGARRMPVVAACRCTSTARSMSRALLIRAI